MPEQAPVVVTDAPPPHPIHLVVSDDLHRRRPRVFFRILFVIPAYIVVSVLGYAAHVVIFLAWLCPLRASPTSRDCLTGIRTVDYHSGREPFRVVLHRARCRRRRHCRRRSSPRG